MPTQTVARPLSDFPALLRTWRQKRRLSQLELALDAGVSQRHVSFLESGRANPSRAMILQLSEVLDVPLRDRNAWLVAAGFAPVFKARDFEDPQMEPIMKAVAMMLQAHEPYPALAIDRAWNILDNNRAFDCLIGMLGFDIWAAIGGAVPNIMRLFFHPKGVRPWIVNWATVGPLLWQRAVREAEASGGTDMRDVLDELASFQDNNVLWSANDIALLPVMPFQMAIGEVEISLFAMIATFGTPQDVTADELRFETLFPANAETDAILKALGEP